MKKIILLIVLIILSLNVYANPIIKIPNIKAPVIDGYVNEWETLKITSFINLTNNDLIDKDTYVWLGFDDKNLYIAYRAYQKNLPKAESISRETGAFWTDDDMEFFIAPNINENGIYQILTNGTGNFRDICNNLPNKQLDIVSKGHISEAYSKIGAKSEDLYFEGEISISLESLGLNKDSEFGFTVLRTVHNASVDSYFAFCDINNKINLYNLLDVSCYTKATFGNCPTLDFQNNIATNVKTNKPLSVNIYKDNEKIINEKITNEYKANLPQGSYIVKSEFLDNNTIIYSNSTQFVNIDVLKYKLDKTKKILNSNVDLSVFKGNVSFELTLYDNNRVYSGYALNSGNNHKKYECPFDLSKLKQGKYTLFLNIIGQSKKYIDIEL